jgi:ribosome-associated protein
MNNTLMANPTLTYTSEQLSLLAAEAADDRKAGDMLLLKVSEVSFMADYFLIVTGYSRAQLRAIAESIQDKVKEHLNIVPMSTEGAGKGNWVLVDYGDVIVHIMSPDDREFYNLEAFWSHGEVIPLPDFT